MEVKAREIHNNLIVQLFRSQKIIDDTFRLEFFLKDGEFLFEAGQYIWLKVNQLAYPDSRGDRRAFSIVSDPQEKNSIAIITRSSESGFKKTLLELPVGSLVEITGPFGSSFLSKIPDSVKQIYFVAGGTGIAPFLSIIKNRYHGADGPQIYLIYSEVAKENFLPEVLALKKNPEYKKFLKIFLNAGKFNWDFIRDNVEIKKDSLWYFSGPGEMINSVIFKALETGIVREQMIFEEYYPIFQFENEIDLAEPDIYRLAVEHSLIHVAVTDVNGRIVYANKAASDITGYSLDEMLGNTPRLWGGLMEPEFYKNLWQIIKIKRRPFIGKVKNRKKSGEYYIAELSIAPIIAKAGGDLVGFSVSEKDITELERIDREKSEFVSIASHQLRTPLTGIRWTLDRLIKKRDAPPEESEYFSDIYKSTVRLSELVDSMLNMSRIESGTVNMDLKQMDIVEFLDDYFKECELLFRGKNLVFNFKYFLDKLEVVTNRNALQNIIQSILYNAIEYTPEKGTIEVVLDKKENTFLLTIRDSGIGIPAEEQGKIFGKFFRASNAKLFKAGGTGIGLYVAAESVKLLGGKIWFESKLNSGTIFYIEFPLISVPVAGKKSLT